MSEHLETDSSSVPVRQETDVIALLKKIQQQMVFLEKKIDLIISQQSPGQSSAQPTGERSYNGDRGDRSSFKERHFSKPAYRPYGPPQGGGFRGDRDRGPRQDRGDRPGGPSRGFSQDRPSYGRPRRDDRNGPPSGGGSGFGGPKKPFYRGRKDRD